MIDQTAVFFLLLIGVITVAIVTGSAPLGCNDVVMVSRLRWEARTPKSIAIMKTPVPHLFLHHTALSECSDLDSCSQMMRTIQNIHMDGNRWDDIGYHFVIGGDGRVYVGRGWNRVGAHIYGYNRISIGFALMGDFTKKAPSNVMLNTTKEMIKCAENRNYVTSNYTLHGHRDAGCTECPGSAFYALIETWPKFEGGPLPLYSCRSG